MHNHYLVQDGHYLAIFNSTHRVMKAEALLKELSVPILLIPAPRALQTDCGLAIRYDKELHQRVITILKNNDVLPAFITHLQDGHFIRQEECTHENH